MESGTASLNTQVQACAAITGEHGSDIARSSDETSSIFDRYPGSKSGAGVYQTVINHIPPHRVYIELCLGGGSIMRRKIPAQINIGIDPDDDVINQWRDLSPGMPLSDDTAENDDDDNSNLHRYIWRCGTAVDFIHDYDWQGNELIYVDPPYVLSTRNNRRYYNHEMTDQDHIDLLEALRELPAKILVSGYWSQLYEDVLNGWSSIQFQTMTHGGARTEWLWANYELPPVELHDYRYLGDNYRERERIKRKINRWKSRLADMPLLEKQAIIAAMKGMGYE